ncbi:MAG: peptidylprolyl isomerase [bacterium]
MCFRYFHYLIVIGIMAGSLLTGCGKSGGDVVAVVGDYEIRLEEFEKTYGFSFQFPTAEDEFSTRQMALDSAIITRLLIQTAYEKNIDQLEELSRVVLANKDKFLIATLLERKIGDRSVPSEAELKEYYNRLEYKVKASHILVKDSGLAAQLVEQISNGESFEMLAYNHSEDKSAQKNRGDLGFFIWGTMIDEFQRAAFAMEPGEVSPPVKSRYGYHIIKVVDRLPNEQRSSYEAMRSSLVDQVTRQKSNRFGEQYFEEIKTRYQVTIDNSTCEYLMHKREVLYPPTVLAGLPRNDFDQEQLDRNEKELILGTWDGGQMSLGKYLDLAGKSIPLNVRPDFDDYDSLAATIFRLNVNNILIVEAHREGIDNDPDYVDQIRFFKELAMAEIMKDDSLPAPPAPDEATVRQYYDDNQELFTEQAKIHIHEMLLSDELKAKRLKKGVRSLEAFKEIASNNTERSGKRIGGGDLGYIERRWFPAVFDAAWKTPIGGIGGPVHNQDGKYVLFYVVDKVDSQLKDYLGQKRSIIQSLTDERKKEVFAAWVEDRRQSTEIIVNEDVLWSTIDMSKYTTVDTTGASE